jgi:hypothetical protein
MQSRNKREGKYYGYLDGKHERQPLNWWVSPVFSGRFEEAANRKQTKRLKILYKHFVDDFIEDF